MGRNYKMLQSGEWAAQPLDGLDWVHGDISIDKNRISGFYDTPFDANFRNLGISTVIFAGVNADHYVLGTPMDANFRGYDTIMLEDCVATTSPDFCLQATLRNVRFCFSFTTSCAVPAEALAA